MKATLIITDDSGNKWEFELPLRNSSEPAQKRHSVKAKQRARKNPARPGAVDPLREDSQIDVSLPIRPFMNRYARGASGAQKFALLVAHSVKGDISATVLRSEVEKQWGKMKGPLGGPFNPAFSTRAKDKGWVDSPKFGVYQLLAGWKTVLIDA